MSEFDLLLQKYISETLSPAELEQFMVWVREPVYEAALQKAIEEHLEATGYTDLTEGVNADKLFAEAMRKGSVQQPVALVRRMAPLRRIVAAAVLVLLMAGAATWFLQHKKENDQIVQQQLKDIPPGKEGAILTLADGRRIVLDSLGNGVIASQQGTRVELKNGLLAYDAAAAGDALIYNTLSTPKGRQFNVLLPDGTMVWLNSGSSIRYPTAFAAKERRVMITGEAYFEVAAGKSKPFIVQLNEKNQVQVLGTKFNINAYEDEAVARTTLLEGAVRVEVKNGGNSNNAAKSVVLKPGQQSRVKTTGDATAGIQTVPVDVDKVMAWRRGFFNFEDAGMDEVMRQLARWYDLEIVYEGNVPPIVFGGELSRNISLSGIIKALEDSKVHLRVEGRKIIILP
jgi:ferric-dicitrate binding protein FerR (iron transport regulator)